MFSSILHINTYILFIIFYNKITKQSLVLDCGINTYLYSIARYLWLKELKDNLIVWELSQGSEVSQLNLPHNPQGSSTKVVPSSFIFHLCQVFQGRTVFKLWILISAILNR